MTMMTCSFWAVALVALVALAPVAIRADCPGTPNLRPIYSSDPVLVKSIENASLYHVGTGENGTTLRVLHLYGSPYAMGYAQGQLLADDIKTMVAAFFEYLDDTIAPYINWLPQDVQKIILEDGPAAALQFEVDLTMPYISQYFLDEIRGLADGCNCGIDYKTVLQVHLFPELIKASCSMFGAWGPAIANVSGTVNQLRALDWGLDNPLVNYSLVAVYHPEEGLGHPFASVTFNGFIGSITSYGGLVGMSEKVWLSYNESASRAGVPFHFLMRDAAQFDRTIDDTLNRIYNSKRTCSVHLGVGSSLDKQFRAVEYSHEEVLVYDDKNYPSYLPAHPLFDGLVFINKHVQPSSDTCMGSLMTKYYGSLDAETTIRNVLGNTASGDMHAAFYDYGNNVIHVSVAGLPVANDGNGTVIDGPMAPAHARPWFRLDMEKLFAQTQAQ
ncbi:uncharacterized protein MONBRDRAFT_36634 [Monosiga brevicollis MX1]|uniref:Uncharacterized protein n=1 Tax=Monosiga brevicollis TaxID=81824 RepID=A9UWH9_MONBE|nr:uncharacterized protein MONBRDRAFT_36634 [Monosiga brevicollis MX1]EDQ90047.1 predicted protein [Monosiga brevicollis MX1]|eukprot:XP_001744814.1 hypothetical protein [Monosiga brevicollis MX1]